MSYISKKSGRKFIVIAASGNAPFPSGTSDHVIANALPKRN
jgi:glucose dehydrogenase